MFNKQVGDFFKLLSALLEVMLFEIRWMILQTIPHLPETAIKTLLPLVWCWKQSGEFIWYEQLQAPKHLWY